MGRGWIAGLCVVLGVFVLAGLGWALLAAAGVFYLTPVPARLRVLAVRAASRSTAVVGRWWRWLLTGRHEVAIVLALAALVLIPVGFGVALGVGAAFIATGVLVGGGALLLGWDSRQPAP